MTDRGRQVVRQWRVLRLVEGSHSGMTVAELHAAISADGDRCSGRTIYRDLEQLSEAGFPILDEDGRWRSLEAGEGGWSVPIRPTELLMLALAEDLFAPLRGTWMGDPLHDLGQKLLAVMTPQGRDFFARLRGLSVASMFAPGDFTDHQEVLATTFRAVNERRRLRLHYRKPNEQPAWREVDPYTVWFHEGTVRLLAWCHKANAIRQFVVQRTLAAELLDTTFTPRRDFDAAAYIRDAFGVFHEDSHDVVIDFHPGVAYLIAERRYHHSQQLTVRDDGWSRLTMQATGLPEIAAWTAGFGGHAIPRQPQALVDRVRQLHADGLAALARA